jgi:hypothetical protein
MTKMRDAVNATSAPPVGFSTVYAFDQISERGLLDSAPTRRQPAACFEMVHFIMGSADMRVASGG